jgi:hypothetical protein
MPIKGLEALDAEARRQFEDETARHEQALRSAPDATGEQLAAEVSRYLTRIDEILLGDARRRAAALA